jgi:hypothetical protein
MTACYRQAKRCAVTHLDEPGHIVQPDCSTTVEDSTVPFSFHITNTLKTSMWFSCAKHADRVTGAVGFQNTTNRRRELIFITN